VLHKAASLLTAVTLKIYLQTQELQLFWEITGFWYSSTLSG